MPVKAFLPMVPRVLKPPLRLAIFALYASCATSASLILPVSTPKATLRGESFPLAADAARLVPLVTRSNLSNCFVALSKLVKREVNPFMPWKPAKAETRAITRALFSETMRARSASFSTTVRTASAICGRAVLAAQEMTGFSRSPISAMMPPTFCAICPSLSKRPLWLLMTSPIPRMAVPAASARNVKAACPAAPMRSRVGRISLKIWTARSLKAVSFGMA